MRDQLTIPMPTQRRRRERPHVHAAALTLRRFGFTVYRAGRHHKVGGKLYTTAEMLRSAQGFERLVAEESA